MAAVRFRRPRRRCAVPCPAHGGSAGGYAPCADGRWRIPRLVICSTSRGRRSIARVASATTHPARCLGDPRGCAAYPGKPGRRHGWGALPSLAHASPGHRQQSTRSCRRLTSTSHPSIVSRFARRAVSRAARRWRGDVGFSAMASALRHLERPTTLLGSPLHRSARYHDSTKSSAILARRLLAVYICT